MGCLTAGAALCNLVVLGFGSDSDPKPNAARAEARAASPRRAQRKPSPSTRAEDSGSHVAQGLRRARQAPHGSDDTRRAAAWLRRSDITSSAAATRAQRPLLVLKAHRALCTRRDPSQTVPTASGRREALLYRTLPTVLYITGHYRTLPGPIFLYQVIAGPYPHRRHPTRTSSPWAVPIHTCTL